jgi:hypothetical protein
VGAVGFVFVAVLAVLSMLGLERGAGCLARRVDAESGKVSSSLGRNGRGALAPLRAVPRLPFGSGLTAPCLPAS